MPTIDTAIPGTERIESELVALAERVRAAVAVVRGSRAGSGSGVVWNSGGLVITNHHVVPGTWAEVEVANGARIPARVNARAENLDLVALQLEGRLLASATAATVGDSTRLRVGELVVAVGNPLGERNAVTLGVVSATGRAASGDGVRDALRLAITLRPGNSGGALVDAWGRIVGIPHMVVGSGQALAVPSHVVERFLGDVEGSGDVFGVSARWVELPAALVTRHGLPEAAGLLVLAVAPGSAADRSGVIIGDVLVSSNPAGGSGVEPDALLKQLRQAAAGRSVLLAVLRAGELRCVDVTSRAA